MYQCKGCRKQFSVERGTIFEDSAVPFDKWLGAIWLLVNAKNGVSSYEVHPSIDVTQKATWFMLQRIHTAMHTGTFETKLGGKARFMHTSQRIKKIKVDGMRLEK